MALDWRLVKQLHELSQFFDVGCEVLIADGTVLIKGVDNHASEKEHITIQREYEMTYFEDEDGFHVEPSFDEVLSKIAEDAGCLRLPTHQT